jgi:hypothetical protein
MGRRTEEEGKGKEERKMMRDNYMRETTPVEFQYAFYTSCI